MLCVGGRLDDTELKNRASLNDFVHMNETEITELCTEVTKQIIDMDSLRERQSL